MIPRTNADQVIARELLRVDRSLWKTLSAIKRVCSEMYMENLFNDYSKNLLETILSIEKLQGELRDEHRSDESTEDRQLLRWFT